MDVIAPLRRWALTGPRVLIAEAPGASALRWSVEAEMDRRGWPIALSPSDTDLLLVLGSPGPELSGAIDVLWSQVPRPRHRTQVAESSSGIGPVLDAAAMALRTAAGRGAAAGDERVPAADLLAQHGVAHADDGGGGHAGHDMTAMDAGGGHAGHDMTAMDAGGGHAGHDMAAMDAGGGHAGHDMAAMDAGGGHAGHQMSEPATEAGGGHAGHDMAAMDAGGGHAGHDMAAMDAGGGHAGHQMSEPATEAGGGHAGHDMAAMDAGGGHAGHQMSEPATEAGGGHAGHDMAAMDAGGGHAGHQMSEPATEAGGGHAGHDMAAMDAGGGHAGHQMSEPATEAGGGHAGHDMAAMDAGGGHAGHQMSEPATEAGGGHAGHDMAAMNAGGGHAGHSMHHGGEVAGLAMAMTGPDRDGLQLDVLRITLGPVLPGWPTGLVVRAQLQGDLLTGVEPTWADEHHPDAQAEPLADPLPLSLDRLARFLVVAGWPAAAREARRARDGVRSLDPAEVAAARRRATRLAGKVRRSRVLAWSVQDMGRAVPAGDGGVRAPAEDVLDRVRRWCEAVEGGTDEQTRPHLPLGALGALLEGTELATARLVVASVVIEPAPVHRAPVGVHV